MQAQRRRAMTAERSRFYAGCGCALPGLRSYDLPLIYSPFLLKLPVLTASKSLRHSRKAVAVSRPGKRSAAGRSGSVPVVVPDGGINALSGLQDHTARPTPLPAPTPR
nr:Uncharacterised protein [Klebsiella pneumoniae]